MASMSFEAKICDWLFNEGQGISLGIPWFEQFVNFENPKTLKKHTGGILETIEKTILLRNRSGKKQLGDVAWWFGGIL